MKKLAVIFLLALFLFNLAGYRLLFDYVQQLSDARLEAALDKDQYDENDLVTIKVPLSLPYQTSWKEVERTDGEVNLDGKIYKYVKRMYYEGEMIYWCLPNTEKMQLQTARDEFFKYANDLMQNSSKKTDHSNNNFSKHTLSDYDDYRICYQTLFFHSSSGYERPLDVSSLLKGVSTTPAQPPEVSKASC